MNAVRIEGFGEFPVVSATCSSCKASPQEEGVFVVQVAPRERRCIGCLTADVTACVRANAELGLRRLLCDTCRRRSVYRPVERSGLAGATCAECREAARLSVIARAALDRRQQQDAADRDRARQIHADECPHCWGKSPIPPAFECPSFRAIAARIEREVLVAK